jgi:hypothetical protein
VRWDGARRIVVTAPAYRDNFLLSHDLRAFDMRLRHGEQMNMTTPLGNLRAETVGNMAELTLTLSPDTQREHIHFFYYSNGRIGRLDAPN